MGGASSIHRDRCCWYISLVGLRYRGGWERGCLHAPARCNEEWMTESGFIAGLTVSNGVLFGLWTLWREGPNDDGEIVYV